MQIQSKMQKHPLVFPQLSNLLKKRVAARAQARKTQSEANLLFFKQLRTSSNSLIKKAKSEFHLSKTTTHLNNPKNSGK